ncbi:MAG: aldolase [Eubacteriaceae bacterium]|jgi:hypothetical protein|nr:aldolase [Eubacteriaceae bacterium]
MPLILMYITNNVKVASIADRYGVDRIWVDLEILGKEKRQQNLNTVKSNHTVEDITAIRNVIDKAELLVRINPLYEKTKREVEEVIARGADVIMLPMFYTAQEAKEFVSYVSGRAKTMLLVETIEAEKNLEEIAKVEGIDEIHIGLNDLHLAYHKRFMFQLLAEGNVDRMCQIIKRAGLPYGFGGIAKLDGGTLSARHIISEHYRLASSRAILSRSFYDSSRDDEEAVVEQIFQQGISEIREFEKRLKNETEQYFEQNRLRVQKEVAAIVKALEEKKND